MSKKTQSLNYKVLNQGKDTKIKDQFNRVYKGFLKQPQSMKMLSMKLNIDRSSVCWYCKRLRENNKIEVVNKSVCKITKRVVNYYTTNPDLFSNSNQLKMF